jgi:hypothetical protein
MGPVGKITTAQHTTMDEWKTGDFTVMAAWTSCERWGDEVALSVEEGDAIVIDFVDSQGWARSVTAEGKHAWVPYAVLRRRVHVVQTCFHERSYDDYLVLNPNDRVVVYAEQDDGGKLWCYGGRLDASKNRIGWFAAEAIGGSALRRPR